MIVLTPTKLHWIQDAADDPHDLCAHSPVDFRIGDSVLVRPEDGDWTVSAAALYLLRTLERSHTSESPVGSPLFPCCGHSMYQMPNEPEAVIIGCNSGPDFEILHCGSDIQIRHSSNPTLTVSVAEWRSAVHKFADAVQSFYDRCTPKQPLTPEDEQAFPLSWHEWRRRRDQ